MIYSDELLAAAKRIFWFGTPEEALEFPKRFLTYAMTYTSDEDIEILRKYFTDDDFKATLEDPAPGIFDRGSCATQVLKISARFTDCSCRSSPQFLAPAFSHSVYPASGSQAYFLVLVVLDSQMGPALHLPPLLYPAALAPREVYPVFPSWWWRLASLRFCCVRRSCEKRDSSSVALLLPELPKSL